MKKILFSFALLTATYGTAGDKKLYHVNLNSGISMFDDSARLEDNALYGLSVSMYERETASYAIELGYERVNGAAYEGIDLETDIDRYFVNMLVDGEEELSITPYVLLGGGYENVSHVYTAYDKTKSQAFVNAGLGFKYQLHDNVNITLEGKALGKFDTESIDYVAKLGLDFMFGSQSTTKTDVIEVLDKEEVTTITKKPIRKHVKKDKKKAWITPEVVKEQFSEQDQDKIYGEKVKDDSAINTMQESLEALKIQMAKNEHALVEKLAILEKELALKKQMIADVEIDKSKQITKKSHVVNIPAKDIKTVEDLRLVQESKEKRIAKRKQEQLRIAKEKKAHFARIAAKKSRLKKIAAQKKAKRLARAKEQKRIIREEKLAQQKALAEFKRIKLAQQAQEMRLEKERLQELKRVQAKKKQEIEAAKMKAAQEKTDTLHVANGMVIFSD